MDRYWLLTWTTYGTWLPGDERGFVSMVEDEATDQWGIHNVPGTPYDSDVPKLRNRSVDNLVGKPIYLNVAQAEQVLEQFHETTDYRRWQMLAAAVMCNHIHIVVAVRGDPDPAGMLRDYKSYASRRLNRKWNAPASGTWWTESGLETQTAE